MKYTAWIETREGAKLFVREFVGSYAYSDAKKHAYAVQNLFRRTGEHVTAFFQSDLYRYVRGPGMRTFTAYKNRPKVQSEVFRIVRGCGIRRRVGFEFLVQEGPGVLTKRRIVELLEGQYVRVEKLPYPEVTHG